MVSLWSFVIWEIDIISVLPMSKGGVKYAIVVLDHITKWAKAKPLIMITTKKVINFAM